MRKLNLILGLIVLFLFPIIVHSQNGYRGKKNSLHFSNTAGYASKINFYQNGRTLFSKSHFLPGHRSLELPLKATVKNIESIEIYEIYDVACFQYDYKRLSKAYKKDFWFVPYVEALIFGLDSKYNDGNLKKVLDFIEDELKIDEQDIDNMVLDIQSENEKNRSFWLQGLEELDNADIISDENIKASIVGILSFESGLKRRDDLAGLKAFRQLRDKLYKTKQYKFSEIMDKLKYRPIRLSVGTTFANHYNIKGNKKPLYAPNKTNMPFTIGFSWSADKPSKLEDHTAFGLNYMRSPFIYNNSVDSIFEANIGYRFHHFDIHVLQFNYAISSSKFRYLFDIGARATFSDKISYTDDPDLGLELGEKVSSFKYEETRLIMGIGFGYEVGPMRLFATYNLNIGVIEYKTLALHRYVNVGVYFPIIGVKRYY